MIDEGRRMEVVAPRVEGERAFATKPGEVWKFCGRITDIVSKIIRGQGVNADLDDMRDSGQRRRSCRKGNKYK
jgi:hypothetical protein